MRIPTRDDVDHAACRERHQEALSSVALMAEALASLLRHAVPPKNPAPVDGCACDFCRRTAAAQAAIDQAQALLAVFNG